MTTRCLALIKDLRWKETFSCCYSEEHCDFPFVLFSYYSRVLVYSFAFPLSFHWLEQVWSLFGQNWAQGLVVWSCDQFIFDSLQECKLDVWKIWRKCFSFHVVMPIKESFHPRCMLPPCSFRRHGFQCERIPLAAAITIYLQILQPEISSWCTVALPGHSSSALMVVYD